MAYNREAIYNQALKVVKDNNLVFIEDIVAYLPISKPTFYEFFPVDSDEFNAIKSEIENNKIRTKQSMRSKWYKSSNATLQISLMKLICTDEERKKLSQHYVDHSSDDGTMSPVANVDLDLLDVETKRKIKAAFKAKLNQDGK